MARPKSHPPALGERAAVTGYHAQYRAGAALVLRRLADGTLDSIRLADPAAGRLDDLQISGRGRLEGYQFKWSRHSDSFTFLDLIRGKDGLPPLIAALADGWRTLRANFPQAHVVPHLISNDVPSTNDEVPGTQQESAPRHFAAFLSEAWEPLHDGELDTPPAKWSAAYETLRQSSGCSPEEWPEFVRVCRLELLSTLDQPPAVGMSERAASAWEAGVTTLAQRLFNLVASPRGEVEFSRARLLSLLGWSDETASRHLHEFPVDERTYEPIAVTAGQLTTALDTHTRGYVCLTGTPGSGKSSLLTRLLRERGELVARYYAFVPSRPARDASARERGEAENFFHDLLLEFQRLGRSPAGSIAAPHRFDLGLLRERFREQLRELGEHYARTGRRTLILVDGLDHIPREQKLVHSLLSELPDPKALPEGVLFLLGTQTVNVLPDQVQRHVLRDQRNVVVQPLPAAAVRRVLRRCGLADVLTADQTAEVVAKVNGHPLVLGMLVNGLAGRSGADDVLRILEAAGQYEGDIVTFYDRYWTPLRDGGEAVLDLLGMLARLRTDVDRAWVASWADPEAWRTLQRRFHQFFRRDEAARRWSFFHNSFRLFVRELTSEIAPGERDIAEDRLFFRRLAEHCASAPVGSFWRGEEVFYRAQAGEDGAVLALVTPAKIREQFFALRPEGELYDQLALGREALDRRPDYPSVVRLGLIDQELRARSETVSMERDTLYRVLLVAGQHDVLLSHLRDGPRLRVDGATALQQCRALLAAGLPTEAHELFDLVDPQDAEPGLPSLDLLAQERHSLVDWLVAGVEVLGVEEAVAVVEQHTFGGSGSHHGWHQNQPEPETPVDHERERQSVLLTAVQTLLAEGRWPLAAELEAQLTPLSANSGRRTQLEFSRAEAHLAAGDQTAAADQLRPLVGSRQFRSDTSRVAWAEACVRAGLLDEAKPLVDAMTRPTLDDAGSSQFHSGHRERPSPLEYYRLRYALGEMSRPVELVPAAGSLVREGLVLFFHAECVVARLWGRAWREEPFGPDEFREEAKRLLAILNREFSGIIQWRGISSSLTVDRLRVFEALVDAGAAHGPQAVTVLTELFGADWERPDRRGYWPPHARRDLCRRLIEHGADRAWAVRELERCETEIVRPDYANGQAGEHSAQAEVWLQLGEVDRAMGMLRGVARHSFRVSYSKDDQLIWWTSLLGPEWAKEDSRHGLRKVSWLAHCFECLRHETDHHLTREAAARLVGVAFRVRPAAAPALLDHLFSTEMVRYDEGLAEMVRAALDDPAAPVLMLFRLVRHLLVPVAIRGDVLLVDCLFTRLARELGADHTAALATDFSLAVRTEAPSGPRRAWLRGAARALRRAQLDASAQALAADSACLRVREEDGTTAANREAEETLLQRLENDVTSLAELRAAKTRETVPHAFPWHEIIDGIAPHLSPADLVAATDLFTEDYRYAEACQVTGAALVARGARMEAVSLAERAVGRLEPKEDSYYHDTRKVFLALMPLLQVASDRALPRLASLHAEHGGPELDQIHSLLSHLPDHAGRAKVVEDLDDVLQALLADCGEPDASGVDLARFEADATPAGVVLAQWLIQRMDHPVPRLGNAAKAAVIFLLREGEATTREAVAQRLADPNQDLDELLLALEAVARVEVPAVAPFQEALANLSVSRSFQARTRVASIHELAGWEPPPGRRPGPLSATYRLRLPEPDELPEESASDARLGRRPGTGGDVRALVSAFEDRLRLLARGTGVPWQNLCHRAWQLAEEMAEGVGPVRDPEREREFARRLSEAALHFPYRRPHATLGERAIFRVLAELVDGGRIPLEALDPVRLVFALHDSEPLLWQPQPRPPWVLPMTVTPGVRTWEQNWLLMLRGGELAKRHESQGA